VSVKSVSLAPSLAPDRSGQSVRRLPCEFYSNVFNRLTGANGEGRTPMPLRALEPKSGKARRIDCRGLSNQRLSCSPTSVVSPDFTRFGPKFGPKIVFESMAWNQQRETVEIAPVKLKEGKRRLDSVALSRVLSERLMGTGEHLFRSLAVVGYIADSYSRRTSFLPPRDVSTTLIAQHFACAWSPYVSGRVNHRVVTATNSAGVPQC
jgi:hypothetical protein